MEASKTLPVIDMTNNETGCCPVFVPEDWHEKEFILEDMLFAKAYTRSFLHMPMNMGKVFTHTMKAIEKAQAEPKEGYVILSKDLSSWKAEHLFKIDKSVPELETMLLSGHFLTKVYDGQYKDIPKLMKDFKAYVEDQGYVMKDLRVFYTTCPKCAKHYGHNYMVFFGQI